MDYPVYSKYYHLNLIILYKIMYTICIKYGSIIYTIIIPINALLKTQTKHVISTNNTYYE